MTESCLRTKAYSSPGVSRHMNPTEVVQSCTGETSIQPLVDVTCSQWKTPSVCGEALYVVRFCAASQGYFNTNPIHVLMAQHLPELGLQHTTWYEASFVSNGIFHCKSLSLFFQNGETQQISRNFCVQGWKIIPPSGGSQKGCSLESRGLDRRWISVSWCRGTHGVLRFRSRPCLGRASGGQVIHTTLR